MDRNKCARRTRIKPIGAIGDYNTVQKRNVEKYLQRIVSQ